MRVISYVCNSCGEKIPMIKKKIQGIEYVELKIGKLNFGYPVSHDVLEASDIHYCESCAEKINNMMKTVKLKMLVKGEV